MIGEQQRRAEVETRVRQELERIDHYRLPVNPVRVANRLGLKVKGVGFKDTAHAGMIAVKAGSGSIFVAYSEDAPYRMRAAIAHSLGHYFLHLTEDGVVKDGQILDRPIDLFWEREPANGPVAEELMREIEANWFAMELLMPTDFIRQEWARNPSVPNIARIFEVPQEAIGPRVAALNLWKSGKRG